MSYSIWNTSFESDSLGMTLAEKDALGNKGWKLLFISFRSFTQLTDCSFLLFMVVQKTLIPNENQKYVFGLWTDKE